MKPTFRPDPVTASQVKYYREEHQCGLYAAKDELRKQNRRLWLANLASEMGPRPWDPNIEQVLRDLIEYLQEDLEHNR
jgi:hypothetical protein